MTLGDMVMISSANDFIETFAALPDWEEKYAYLIDLGKKLPVMAEALKVDEILVPGCTSRVWMIAASRNENGETRYHFAGDSDAAIVKGLVAVLLALVQDKTAAEIDAIDVAEIFGRLGLSEHLTPSRRNGFFAMVDRIRKLTR
jgi:cysteine desulfuration protein SufE